MTSVTLLELARRIVQALGVNEGEAIDLSKLRDGSILVRRVNEP